MANAMIIEVHDGVLVGSLGEYGGWLVFLGMRLVCCFRYVRGRSVG